MDIYLLLKLVHVMAAIVWVGGGAVFALLALLVGRRGSDAEVLAVMGHVATLGSRVFMPMGFLTLASAGLLFWVGGLAWEAWIVLSIGIVAVTFALGATVLGPSCDRVMRLWREDGDVGAATALARQVLRFAKLDVLLQLAIVSLMVLKPGWSDPLLAVPALLAVLGGASLLAPLRAVAAQPA